MQQQDQLRAKIEFRISPVLELALSLLVIVSPERFAPVDDWVERVVQRLPVETVQQLRREATETDYLGLACELEEASGAVPAVLERLEQSNPQVGRLLLDYWQAFAPELAATTGILGRSIQEETSRLAEVDAREFVSAFSDRVNVSADGSALVLEWGRGMRVPFDRLERLLFVPSTFCPRKIMFYRHGSIQLLFYNPEARETTELPEAPESLVLGFAALADSTRLKLLKLIAREKLPAQEMARRLEVHESTVSRHLKFLVEAGHVAREHQEGKYIFYSLNLDRLDTLATALRAYLG